jgi:hypothetical protein
MKNKYCKHNHSDEGCQDFICKDCNGCFIHCVCYAIKIAAKIKQKEEKQKEGTSSLIKWLKNEKL